MSTNPQLNARRVRDEVINSSITVVREMAVLLAAAVADTSDLRGITFTQGMEWVGADDEEAQPGDGRRCMVETITVTLGCGCIHHVEAVGGSITLGKPHLCREHRPALVMVMTPVAPLTDADIPF